MKVNEFVSALQAELHQDFPADAEIRDWENFVGAVNEAADTIAAANDEEAEDEPEADDADTTPVATKSKAKA